MEHVTIKPYRIDPNTGNQIYRMLPDEGYLLKSKKSGKLFSEAITEKPDEFEVVIIN